MQIQNYFKFLKQELAKSNVDVVIQQLITLLEGEPFQNDIIQLSARYEILKSNERSRLVKREELSIDKNVLISDLLSLIELFYLSIIGDAALERRIEEKISLTNFLLNENNKQIKEHSLKRYLLLLLLIIPVICFLVYYGNWQTEKNSKLSENNILPESKEEDTFQQTSTNIERGGTIALQEKQKAEKNDTKVDQQTIQHEKEQENMEAGSNKQEFLFYGIILDAESGKEIEGVKLFVNNREYVSAVDGQFRVNVLFENETKVLLQLGKDGYETTTRYLDIRERNDSVQIKMKKKIQ